MKAYLVTTAILFTVVALLHVWEIIDRRHLEVEDPIVVGLAVSMALWGWRLSRRPTP